MLGASSTPGHRSPRWRAPGLPVRLWGGLVVATWPEPVRRSGWLVPRFAAGLIAVNGIIEKTGTGVASRTSVYLTRTGRAALDAYTEALRDLLAGL